MLQQPKNTMLQQQEFNGIWDRLIPLNDPKPTDENFEEFYRKFFSCKKELFFDKLFPANVGDDNARNMVTIFSMQKGRIDKNCTKMSLVIELSKKNRYKIPHFFDALHFIKFDNFYMDKPVKAILYINRGKEFFPIKTVNLFRDPRFSFYDVPIMIHPCYNLSIEIIYENNELIELYGKTIKRKIKMETFYFSLDFRKNMWD